MGNQHSEPFVAVLRPYRSLGARGFFVLMTLSGLVVAAGILLLAIGWPLKRWASQWTALLARIVSSWITAIAGLVLALSL